VIVVGLSHKSAPIEVRERLAIGPTDFDATLARLHGLDEVGEVLLLSTCNRVEVFAFPARDVAEATLCEAVTTLLADHGGREVVPHLRSFVGLDAVRHLFRVASSLDSLVVGEPQILGQLKEAIRAAAAAQTLGPVLGNAVKSALQLAKRVRTDTAIGAGQVSVPSVAVDLARQIFEQLTGHVALLVGAGEMAETAARLLVKAGAPVWVVNRNPERAAALASAVGGTPHAWDALDACLIEADIVVSSTSSPDHVIRRDQLKRIRRQRRGRSLFLIDIAVPRDIDPTVNELDGVYLYDIDDLSHVVARALDDRKVEAERAETMVEREARRFEERRSQESVKPVIVALRSRTRELLAGELDKSCKSRLKHLDDADRQALAVMMDAAVNKLMHEPTRRLKELATTAQGDDAAQLVSQLFGLEEAVAAAREPLPVVDDLMETEPAPDAPPAAAPATDAADAPASAPRLLAR
jgi:glutamyl-tRNA reductase